MELTLELQNVTVEDVVNVVERYLRRRSWWLNTETGAYVFKPVHLGDALWVKYQKFAFDGYESEKVVHSTLLTLEFTQFQDRLLIDVTTWDHHPLLPFVDELLEHLEGGWSSKPTDAEAGEPADDSEPRVPSRPADLRKWKATWQVIENQARKGMSYSKIEKWLEKTHPELVYSERVISDIVAAGEAGLLNE